jgi:pyrimidine-nucleoside phosphorylase
VNTSPPNQPDGDLARFLRTKRDGKRHSQEEIDAFIQALVTGKVPPEIASAWLMAVYLRGLDEEETQALTWSLARSGETVSLAELGGPVVDKHSTGGVGDAVTLLFLPLASACGLKVVKMSGKSLGFTGGTLDKVASIPGFRYDLSPEELIRIAKKVGCALAGQTERLAPGDKILYALRDKTQTVESIPLISASVMSKKLAAGADHFVFDVKCGNGAFMREASRARELAQNLVNIATRSGKRATAFITDMSQPLASAVGNALEVETAVEELKNGCQNRLGQVAKILCQGALSITGTQATIEDVLSSGKALEVMARWIEAQGGNPKIVDNPRQHLPKAKVTLAVKAPRSGFVNHFNTAEIGAIARWLFTEGEEDRYGTGLRLAISLGDYVHEGDEIFIVHASNPSMAHRAEQELLKSISITEEPVSPPPLIHAEVNP